MISSNELISCHLLLCTLIPYFVNCSWTFISRKEKGLLGWSRSIHGARDGAGFPAPCSQPQLSKQPGSAAQPWAGSKCHKTYESRFLFLPSAVWPSAGHVFQIIVALGNLLFLRSEMKITILLAMVVQQMAHPSPGPPQPPSMLPVFLAEGSSAVCYSPFWQLVLGKLV